MPYQSGWLLHRSHRRGPRPLKDQKAPGHGWGFDRVGCRGLRPGTLPHTTGRAVFRIRRLNAAALYTVAARSDGITNPQRRNTLLLSAACKLGLAAIRPRASRTERHFQHSAAQPQASQLAQPAPPVVPPLPKAFPNVSPDPAFQPENVAAVLGQPVVTPPASDIRAPAIPQLRAALALAAAPQLPDLRLGPFHTLGGRFDLSFRIDHKTQELALPGRPHPALVRVDVQALVFLDPFGDARQHSLCRPLAAHKDVAVVSVPAKRQAALFQLLVQRVEVYVGQQRRDRPALRRAFLACLHHPFDHHTASRATTASADFPPPLSGGISPGQVPDLSLHAHWLYVLRRCLLGFARASLLARGRPPHCQFVFLKPKVCLQPFQRVPCGSRLAFSYGCRHHPRRGHFTPIGSAPAGHTSPRQKARRLNFVVNNSRHVVLPERGVVSKSGCACAGLGAAAPQR